MTPFDIIGVVKIVISVFFIINLLLIGWILRPQATPVEVVESVLPTAYPYPTVKVEPFSADKLFELVNNWRVEEGYQPYIKSEFACNVADVRLPQVQVDWSHDKFLSLVESGFFGDNIGTVGENLAKGYETNDGVLTSWLNSPDHRVNLEGNYTHSCIKCDSGYCVHIFTYF